MPLTTRSIRSIGSWAGISSALLLTVPVAAAGTVPAVALQDVVVRSQRLVPVGEVTSASEGTVPTEQLESRPILRPAEILEAIPGLVVTQHSGDGKANQYFLRGFNLDHGTDFASRVDGIPVNMPTHAHGQGYSDLNFLIPELVDHVEYRKGTYYPEEGNFSAAGSADVEYRRRLDAPFVSLAAGQGGYSRAVAAAAPAVGDGTLLTAAEYMHNDGPWELPEAYRKLAALLRYGVGDPSTGHGVEAQAYDAHWRASDQIPLRAVVAGLIGRFGAVDPTDGGATRRYALSADWWGPAGGGRVKTNAYAIDYRLELVSNFTYYLDPSHGDQFEQSDARRVWGADVEYVRPSGLLGHAAELSLGSQFRFDDISPVGLYRTEQGVRYATLREDRVRQSSTSLYAGERIHWTAWLRSDLGIRADRFTFRVQSNLPLNSGAAAATIASPKLSIAFGPWAGTEYFLNLGDGFHSNDARGTTTRVDPADGRTPVAAVRPLVRAVGAEAGMRSAVVSGLQLALSWWTLRLDSELVYSGDGGTTEPSRASRRTGVELGLNYTPREWLAADADLAWTRARYLAADPAGDRIPNALQVVASVGVTVKRASGWFGSARLRYFGPAPLVSDDSVRSDATALVNLSVGYHVSSATSVVASVFNLLDRTANDISYFYASRLRGEGAPIDDIHFHPLEPRTLRCSLTTRF